MQNSKKASTTHTQLTMSETPTLRRSARIKAQLAKTGGVAPGTVLRGDKFGQYVMGTDGDERYEPFYSSRGRGDKRVWKTNREWLMLDKEKKESKSKGPRPKKPVKDTKAPPNNNKMTKPKPNKQQNHQKSKPQPVDYETKVEASRNDHTH